MWKKGKGRGEGRGRNNKVGMKTTKWPTAVGLLDGDLLKHASCWLESSGPLGDHSWFRKPVDESC